MSDMVRGMVVYNRKTYRRGTITAGNQFTGIIAVKWDDGGKDLIHVTELMSEKLYNEIKEQERNEAMSLKAEHAIIGATVYVSSKTAPLVKAKIASPLQNNLVILEYEGGQLNKKDIKHLLSEVDGITENKRLLDEQEKLEREFADVEQQCKVKLKQAAALVQEAAKLAHSKNVDIQDMHDATHDLEYAMEAAGWRTSSWHC